METRILVKSRHTIRSISRSLSPHRRSIKASPLKARGPIRPCIIRYATGVFDAAIRRMHNARPTSWDQTLTHSLSPSLWNSVIASRAWCFIRGDRNGMAMGPATNRAARDRITPRLVGPSNTRKLHQPRHRVTVIYVPSNLISFYVENRPDLSSRTRSEGPSFFQRALVFRPIYLKNVVQRKYSMVLR